MGLLDGLLEGFGAAGQKVMADSYAKEDKIEEEGRSLQNRLKELRAKVGLEAEAKAGERKALESERVGKISAYEADLAKAQESGPVSERQMRDIKMKQGLLSPHDVDTANYQDDRNRVTDERYKRDSEDRRAHEKRLENMQGAALSDSRNARADSKRGLLAMGDLSELDQSARSQGVQNEDYITEERARLKREIAAGGFDPTKMDVGSSAASLNHISQMAKLELERSKNDMLPESERQEALTNYKRYQSAYDRHLSGGGEQQGKAGTTYTRGTDGKLITGNQTAKMTTENVDAAALPKKVDEPKKESDPVIREVKQTRTGKQYLVAEKGSRGGGRWVSEAEKNRLGL